MDAQDRISPQEIEDIVSRANHISYDRRDSGTGALLKISIACLFSIFVSISYLLLAFFVTNLRSILIVFCF